MAETSLDRLFQRIIESEQTEENRREHIAALKAKIHDAKAELKSLNESCTSSKGRLHILIRQFHTEKAEAAVLNGQKKSLEKQKSEMQSEVEKLKSQYAEMREQMYETQSRYSRRVRDFCADFDLTGEGAKKRKEAALKELDIVAEELAVEEKKYASMLKEEEKVTEAMEQRVCLQAEISQLQSQIIEADSHLEKKRQEAREAALKADQVRSEIQRDPELLQLQRKFESISKQNRELESKVRNLNAELSRTKRNQYQGDNETSASAPPTKLYKFHSFARK